ARALAAAGQVGDAYGLAYGLYITAGVRLMEQRHADGVDLAERALSALGTQRVQPDLQLAPQVIRGFCLLELDRLADADAAVEHDGYPDRALAELMAYVERGVQRLPYPIKLNYLYPEIARLAAQVGDAEPAARVRAFLDPLVVDEPAANLRAVAQLCRGVAGG